MVCLLYSKVSKVNNDFIFTKSGAVRENSALTRGVRKAVGFATPTPRKSSSEVLAGGGIMCLPERVRPLHFFKNNKDNRDNNDYKEINALFKDNIRGGLLPPCVVNLANRAAALPKQNPASVRGWLSRKSRYTTLFLLITICFYVGVCGKLNFTVVIMWCAVRENSVPNGQRKDLLEFATPLPTKATRTLTTLETLTT